MCVEVCVCVCVYVWGGEGVVRTCIVRTCTYLCVCESVCKKGKECKLRSNTATIIITHYEYT